MKRKIYAYEGTEYPRAMNKLKASKLSARNKALINNFQDKFLEVKSEDSDKRFIAFFISKLIVMLELLNKDADKITEKDLTTLNNKLRTRTYTRLHHNNKKRLKESTIKSYKVTLKRFLKFLGKEDIFKENGLVRKTNSRKKKEFNFSDIITETDIQQLTKSCNNDMEKALINILWESGARISELLLMKVKDIWKEDNICKIKLFGKTGERVIPIVSSIPYIFRWLEIHPDRKPDSELWIGQCYKYKNKPIEYIAVQFMLRRLFRRAELKKPCNPHWFRHSRASLNGTWMTENQLCLYMGWTIGSDMARIYTHINSNQLTDVVKQHHNLLPKKQQAQKDTPRICKICDNINTAVSEFCSKCGTPLTLRIAINSEQRFNRELKETVKLFVGYMKDEEKRKGFEEWCKEKKSKTDEEV